MDLETRFKTSKNNTNPLRYGLKTILDIDHTKLNRDGNIAKYSGVSILGSGKDISRLNIDNIPKKYHG